MRDDWRLVQVRVGTGEQRVGSGYLVRSNVVLTAAHVVDVTDGRTPINVWTPIEVRFCLGDAVRYARVDEVSLDRREHSDMAALVIEAFDYPDTVIPPRLGAIDPALARLAATAQGYPDWKLRTFGEKRPPYRDSAGVHGELNLRANDRSGAVEFLLDDHEPAAGWAGMSGGPVWVGDTLVGVVSQNWPAEGAGRLTVRRLSSLYAGGSDSEYVRHTLDLPVAEHELATVHGHGEVSVADHSVRTSLAQFELARPGEVGRGLDVDRRYVVGRSGRCHIVATDAGVAAEHCRVSVGYAGRGRDHVVHAEDLGSPDGTWGTAGASRPPPGC